MYDQLSLLYQQLKEQKISQEDALKQIKELKSKFNTKISPQINITNENKKDFVSLERSSPEIDTGNLLEKVQAALIQAVSKLLNLKPEAIDVDTELNEYGFDSIRLTQFANNLNREYQLELTPTIFFEYPTLHGFAENLIKEYQAVFASRFGDPPGWRPRWRRKKRKKQQAAPPQNGAPGLTG